MHAHTDTTPGSSPRSRRPRRDVRAVLVALVLSLIAAAMALPAVAMTSHAGWPANQHLAMDKGPAGREHVLRGKPNVHNYLLGGYGNDTIYGGNAGDVIWGDYHPTGWPESQTAVIHAGNGKNYIYANDTRNYVWTGTNRLTVVHAHEGSGIIHCQNRHQTVYTSHHALPHYKLHGCRHISFYSVGY